MSNSAGTILATEMWGIQTIMQSTSNISSGVYVSNSRRPVSGISVKETAVSAVNSPDHAYLLPIGNSFGWAQLKDMNPNPGIVNSAVTTPDTTLDFVGRNHGSIGAKFGNITYTQPNGTVTTISGWDMRTSNFLYLDGHVENKNVADTVYPQDQWGAKFYSLPPY